MNLQPQANEFDSKIVECMRLHKCWGWFLVLGILLMVGGFLAIGATVFTTLVTILFLGFLLIGGGVVQIVNAFVARNWRGFLLHLLVGILQLFLGIFMIDRPGEAAEGFTLVLAASFLVGGALRIVYSLVEDFPGRFWVLINGIITLALGVMIWRDWPKSSFWVIGLFVGIDLIFNGWSWVMLGLLVKASGKGTATPPAPART